MLRGEPADCADRGGGDHGDTRLVEDATVEMHHLDRRTVAATDLLRQLLAEERQILSLRRADMRREVSIDGGPPPLWGKEDQLRELSGRQPWEAAAIADPTEGETPVAVQTVPAQVGSLERFAAHGLHRVPEERLDLADLDGHVRCRPIGAEMTPGA